MSLPLTPAQQALHTASATALRELHSLRDVFRDMDAAVGRIEATRTVDASFCAEDTWAELIFAITAQLESAGIAAPSMMRVAA